MRARSPAEGVRQLSPQVYGPNGPDHDVIVIGGGCIGAGIARDAALRGLSVLLVEQGDLAAGASGSAAGIVHGAAGALLGFAQARLPGDGSPEEILFWQQTARHLLQRTPCLVPVRGSQRLARLRLASLEARLRQAAGSMPQDGDRPRGLAAAAVHRLLPGLAEPAVGGVLFDLWSVQPDRLVVANAIAAVEAGAEIQLGQRLEALLCTATGRVYGVKLRGVQTGLLQERTAAVVVNAAGAWAAQVAAMAGQLLRLRLRRCVQLRAARPLGVFGLVARAIDGRQVHLLPVRQSMLIGTTDDDWLGEPDDPQVNLQDVEYLLQAVAELDPALHQTPLLDTLVGLRAAEQDWSSDRFSYGARLVDHGLTGASGLLSVVGGSLASYRAIAELTVDRLCWRLKRTLPCRTHRLPLPGGERQIHVPLLAESVGLPVEVVRLLVSRQGDRAREVLAGSPGEQEIVCACSGVTAAEIHHVIRYEWVRDLAALRRRTELGRGTCHGCRCAGRAAQLIGLELGLSPRHVRALVLQDEGVRYRMQLPVAGGTVSARLAMQRMLSLTGRDLEECS